VGTNNEEVGFGLARKRDESFSHLSCSGCHADAHVFAAQNTRDPFVEKSFEKAL
jgi:hypothetical protein